MTPTPAAGGYTAGRSYVRSFRAEVAPSWLRAVQVLRGRPALDLDRPFRLLDLGCGHGFTAVLAAAAHPHAEVLGIDIDPEHVLAARALAAEVGAGNATFREASFAELLDEPHGRWDVVVCYGVYTWVSPAERARLVDLFGRLVATGGLVCLGYNAMPGWASAQPLRDLARSLAAGRAQAGREAAVGEAFALFDALAEAKAGIMADNPPLRRWLDRLRHKPLGYLVHELLPTAGTALWHHEVAADLARARLAFLGSAHLLHNFDRLNHGEAVRAQLEAVAKLGLAETVRDLASDETFRIDVFARGAPPLPMAAAERALEALPVAASWPPPTEPVLATVQGHLPLEPAVAAPVLACAAEGPVTLGALADAAAAHGVERAAARRVAVAMLAGGLLTPLATLTPSAASAAACQRFHRAARTAWAGGDPWPALASPLAAAGIPLRASDGQALAGDDATADRVALDGYLRSLGIDPAD